MTAGWLQRRSHFHSATIAAAADDAFKAGDIAKATALYRSILKHHRRSPHANAAMNFLLSRRTSSNESNAASESAVDAETRSKIWPVTSELAPRLERAARAKRRDRPRRSVPIPALLAIATLEAASGAAAAMPSTRASADEQPSYEERTSSPYRGARGLPWKDRFVADVGHTLELRAEPQSGQLQFRHGQLTCVCTWTLHTDSSLAVRVRVDNRVSVARAYRVSPSDDLDGLARKIAIQLLAAP